MAGDKNEFCPRQVKPRETSNMPKKKNSKNSKNKKGGSSPTKRALVYKEDLQEYVLMTKMLGDRRIMVTLPDTSETMAVIPGRFRKRVWMKPGDVLLASYRDFQENKLDIVYKYNTDEIRKLVNQAEIPPFFQDMAMAEAENNDSGFTFDNTNGDKSSDDNEDETKAKFDFSFDEI
jgi:translation initiation factor 1A